MRNGFVDSTRLASWHRTPLLAVVVLGLCLVLAACGFTDSVGTNFNIGLEGEDPETSAAPIGVLTIGEEVRVTFVVTPKDEAGIDRTAQATFTLENRGEGDDASLFNLVESPDLTAQPYHVLSSYAYGATAALCATYSGPEVVGPDPVEVCRTVQTVHEPDPEL